MFTSKNYWQMALTFIFILFSLKVSALDLDIQIKERFLAANYDSVIELYEEDLDENKSIMERDTIEIVALSYLRKEDFQEANKTYTRLIALFHRSEHKRFINLVRGNSTDYSAENLKSSRLPLYYFLIASSYVQATQESRNIVGTLESKNFSKAKTYIKLAKLAQHPEEEVQGLEEALEEKKTKITTFLHKSSYYAFIQYMTWQDTIILNSPDGTRSEILNTTKGQCSGAGYLKKNVVWGYFFDACVFTGSSTVDTLDSSITYTQNGVSVLGVVTGPGIVYSGMMKNLNLGFQIPVIYRKGDWIAPSGSHSLDDTSTINGAYSLSSELKIKQFSYVFKVGKIFRAQSAHWSFGVNYYF
jgi:hypothetical protein